MAIVIHKDNTGIKFFLKNGDQEPAAVIYSGSNAGIISGDIILSKVHADGMSQILSIMGIFIMALDAEGDDVGKKAFPVEFFNIVNGFDREQKYTSKQVLANIFSGSIVTVDKKKRLKYEFIDFSFKNNKLIINFKPVIW